MDQVPRTEDVPRPAPERRTAPRVAATLAVEVLRGDGLPPVAGQSLDVGTGGVCVQAEEAFDRAAVCGVRLELFGGRRCALPAVVRWQRRIRGRTVLTGLQFGPLEPETTEALWSLMQSRALQIARFLLEARALPGLDLDGALDLALIARRREFPPQAPLFRAGRPEESEDSIFVIVHGELDLLLDCQPPKRYRLGSGAIVGGAPLVLGIPHLESARPVTHVQALEIDAYSYERLRFEKPVTARMLERSMAVGQVQRLSRALPKRAGE